MSIQKINVKNTYVATVKSDVASRALSFYVNDVKKDIFVEDSVFPSVNTGVSTLADNANLNEVINSTENSIDSEVVDKEIQIPTELNIDNTTSVPVISEENNQDVVAEAALVDNNLVRENVSTIDPTIEIPNLNVLETQPVDNNVSPTPMPSVPEAVIHPEPIPNPLDSEPINPTPMNVNLENMNVTMANSNDLDNKIPMFNASQETNLLGALGENQGQSSIGNINVTPENLNVVREFGVDEPIVTDQNGVPVANVAKGGFANSKILLLFVIILFLGSCVFLGYEVYKYVNLPK